VQIEGRDEAADARCRSVWLGRHLGAGWATDRAWM